MADGTGGRYDQTTLRKLVETERERADRAAIVASRHESLLETATVAMRPFHLRMAQLHRATESRHRAAADLHESYIDAVKSWETEPEQAELPPAFMSSVAEASGIRSLAVTLFTQGESGAAVVVSDPVAARVNDLEYVFGEGPSRGIPFRPGVCGERELLSRWPRFGPAARELGVRAVVSARLGLLEAPLGTLIAYRPEPEPDAVVARSTKVVADVLTDTALHPGTLIDVEDGLPLHPLFGDSDLRVVVHQATGMIMSSRQCTASDALALIRGHAYSLDESVIEVARMIVDRTTALN